MMEFMKKLFSEADNQTPCPVRVAAGISNVIYHLAAVAGICMGSIHLDISTLGQYLQHMATLIGVGGVSVGAKSIMKADANAP
jgi:hypothetical protein